MPELMNVQRCRACEVEEGSLHHLYCTREICPFCLGQLASCACIKEVLALTPEECTAVDEYIDDFEEPLKGIINRWANELAAKGRLRFVATPNLCRRCGAVNPPLF